MRTSAAALLVLLAAATAHADDPREEAKAEFEAGQRADAAHDYLAAAQHYEVANTIQPHPFAMFNIAVDRERLGQFRQAVEWYESYLRAETDPSDRDKIRGHIAELRAKPAPLSIRTMPPGARATIDGRDAGITPVTAKLAGGHHVVAVVLDGQREQRDVTADCGEPLDVQFSLRGQEGTLDVSGTPDGALVTVDDVPLGRAPAKLVVAPGPHHVVVSQIGYTPFDTQTTIRPDATTELPFTLQQGGSGATQLPGTLGSTEKVAGWFLGAAGGGDTRGLTGAFYEAEIGGFVNSWGAELRLGASGKNVSYQILARYEPQWRLRPFFTAGYSYLDSTLGLGLSAGLGLVVLRTKTVDYLLKGEVAVRLAKDAMGSTTSAVPIGVVLEVSMHRTLGVKPVAPAASTPAYPGPAYQ